MIIDILLCEINDSVNILLVNSSKELLYPFRSDSLQYGTSADGRSQEAFVTSTSADCHTCRRQNETDTRELWKS